MPLQPRLIAYLCRQHLRTLRSTYHLLTVSLILLTATSRLLADPLFEKRITPGGLSYGLYAPQPLDKTRRYPLVVFLHGAGEIGRDDYKQISASLNPNVPFIFANTNEAFVLAPQTWNSWNIQARYDAIISEIDRLNTQNTISRRNSDGTTSQISNPWKGCIDNDRLYITGFSLGGEGAWFFLSQTPARFAAGVPVAGATQLSWAPTVAQIPTWSVYGTMATNPNSDGVIPIDPARKMVTEMRALGGNPIFSEFGNVVHTQLVKAFENPNATPTNPRGTNRLINWLFEQRRNTSPQVTPYLLVTSPLGTGVYDAGLQKSLTIRGLTDTNTNVSRVSWINQTSKSPESPAIGTLDWFFTAGLNEGVNLITIVAQGGGLVSIPSKSDRTMFSTGT